MLSFQDGPASTLFEPVSLNGNVTFNELTNVGISDEMATSLDSALSGNCVSWGIRFEIKNIIAIMLNKIFFILSV